MTSIETRNDAGDEAWEVIIRPKENIEKIVLDRISIIMSCMTTSSSLLFPGNIDFTRFEIALQKTSEICPWLFCSLHVNDEEVSVVPRVDDGSTTTSTTADSIDGYIKCEFSRLPTEFDRTKDLLPQNVHEKMSRVDLAMASLQDLPVAAFRVIQFKSHFVISYRLNHGILIIILS